MFFFRLKNYFQHFANGFFEIVHLASSEIVILGKNNLNSKFNTFLIVIFISMSNSTTAAKFIFDKIEPL